MTLDNLVGISVEKIDYTGDLVPENMVAECIDEAEKLFCVFREQN